MLLTGHSQLPRIALGSGRLVHAAVFEARDYRCSLAILFGAILEREVYHYV